MHLDRRHDRNGYTRLSNALNDHHRRTFKPCPLVSLFRNYGKKQNKRKKDKMNPQETLDQLTQVKENENCGVIRLTSHDWS